MLLHLDVIVGDPTRRPIQLKEIGAIGEATVSSQIRRGGFFGPPDGQAVFAGAFDSTAEWEYSLETWRKKRQQWI